MQAITNRLVAPPTPIAAERKYIYPWEHTELAILCKRLYIFAAKTGYTGTLEEFKEHFGAYLENHDLVADEYIYDGQYVVTPLPLVEQILQTRHTVLEENVIVEPIPYYTTTNNAGGYTAIIG